MATVLTVDRRRWLGFRWQRHGLDGRLGAAGLDDLLRLGIQAGRQAGAEQSLLQRTAEIGSTSVTTAIRPDGPLVSFWSVRGAPHAHRITHLDFVRDALAPQASDEGGPAYVDAVAEVAAALTAVVTGPTSKAQASADVTARVSAGLVTWCERCQARHVPDGLFRAAGRQAQLVLGPEERRATMLHPAPQHPQERVDRPGLTLLDAYLRVNGPTSRTLFRDWTDGGAEATAELWRDLPGDLTRVQVDGRRYDLPDVLVAAVQDAPEPRGVVLVPPGDPYLRQVDRALLVPDSKRRQEVWRALSGPGALLVDGEVAGTWRYRRGDDDVTITPFAGVTPGQRKQARHSADLVAEAGGGDQPAITWT